MVLRGGGGLEAGLDHLRAKPKRGNLDDVALDDIDEDWFGKPDDVAMEEPEPAVAVVNKLEPITATELLQQEHLDTKLLPGGNYLSLSGQCCVLVVWIRGVDVLYVWVCVGPDESNNSELAKMRKVSEISLCLLFFFSTHLDSSPFSSLLHIGEAGHPDRDRNRQVINTHTQPFFAGPPTHPLLRCF